MKYCMYIFTCIYIFARKRRGGRETVGHCVLEENKFYNNTDMSICRRPIEMFSVLCWWSKVFQRISLCCRAWQSARQRHARSRGRYVSQHSMVHGAWCHYGLMGWPCPDLPFSQLQWPALVISPLKKHLKRKDFPLVVTNTILYTKFSFSTSVDDVHLWGETVLKFTVKKRYRYFKINSRLISN